MGTVRRKDANHYSEVFFIRNSTGPRYPDPENAKMERLTMTATIHPRQDADDLLVGAQIQMTAAVSGVVPDDTFTVSHAVNALGFGRFQIILRQVVASTTRWNIDFSYCR